MAITNKIISFWKQVRAKSSDMFTLFKVGVGVKVPTHKLHVKDSTDPVKIEGVQSDTSSSTKLLVLDSNNVVKHGTVTNLSAAGVSGAANQLLTDDGDGTVTSESKFIFDSTANQVTLGSDDINTVSIIRKTHSDGDGGKIDIEGGNSGGTNNPGGDVRIYGGKGTGNALGGAIEFYCSTPTSSGSTAHFVHGADMKISDQLVHVTGNITLSGTVDGRDVATDGTKLDGIEASADVTDTANVTAAGALMDSEVTNLSQVKAFDSSDYATAAQGAKADSAQQPPSEGAFVNGDKTKLDGIEASADVTDATNVTAAGALMDSELTDLAGIKSLDTSTIVTLADAQTIAGAKTFDRKLTLDGNKSVTASGDGVTLHVDAQDITDTSTAASGTTGFFNHVVIENPRLMATNSSVTTTEANTVYIKGAPVASTNQTITNSYALKVQAGNVDFGADLEVGANLNVTGIITGKQREIYSQSFLDDLGTTKHYLPWKDINEQTTIYQEEAAMLMPCDGRIVSVTVKVMSVTGSGNMTIGVNTIAPNINAFGSANWTEEETETLAVASTDDYHVFHFAFDNAKHFDSGDLVTISIQNDADLSGTTYWYVSTVVEYDWNTFLGTTSAEHDSNP